MEQETLCLEDSKAPERNYIMEELEDELIEEFYTDFKEYTSRYAIPEFGRNVTRENIHNFLVRGT